MVIIGSVSSVGRRRHRVMSNTIWDKPSERSRQENYDHGYREGYKDAKRDLEVFLIFYKHCKKSHSLPDICCPNWMACEQLYGNWMACEQLYGSVATLIPDED